MAGLLIGLLIGASAEGIEKHRTKRAEKKRARQQEERNQTRQMSKAQEAEEERLRAEAELEETDHTEISELHPALRGQAVEAPPAYLRNVPSYEEHHSHTLVGEDDGVAAGSSRQQSVSPPEVPRRSSKRRYSNALLYTNKNHSMALAAGAQY